MKYLIIAVLALLPSLAFGSTETVTECTQPAVEIARDAAGVGGTVVIPNCTTTVDNLQVTVADQTWVMRGNAKFLRSTTTTGPILKLVANGFKLRGGTLDGARGVNLNQNVGIDSTKNSFDWRDGTMQNVPGWGVAIDSAPMRLDGVQFKNIFNACVIWRNAHTVTLDGPLIENVLCDRSNESPTGINSGGILVQATAGKWVINPRIVNFDVRLPPSDAYANVAVEVINGQHVRVLNGKTVGGRIGISFGNVSYGIITGNIVQVPIDYAIELATGSSGVNVQANNATGYGPSRWGIIASGGSSGLKALGNAFAGFTGAAPAGGGACTGNPPTSPSNVCWYTGASFAVNYGN